MQVYEYDTILGSIKAAIHALKEFDPAVVVHCIVPDAGIACHVLNIPNILFGPIPLKQSYIRKYILNDIPDFQATWFTDLLPLWVRIKIMENRFQSKGINKESVVVKAARKCGWISKGDIYESALNLVADIPSNCEEKMEDVVFTGAIFSQQTVSNVPDDIRKLLSAKGSNDDKPKVLVTMASSGAKNFVVEAVKAISDGRYRAAVVLSPTRCSCKDVKESMGGISLPEDCVVLTEEFVSTREVAGMVDVVVGHGGQGTVQTALSRGTPIVGVGMQWEQQYNLDNVARRGAGIRVPKRRWKAREIREAIDRVLGNESYAIAARELKEEIEASNGSERAASLILQVAEGQTPK